MKNITLDINKVSVYTGNSSIDLVYLYTTLPSAINSPHNTTFTFTVNKNTAKEYLMNNLGLEIDELITNKGSKHFQISDNLNKKTIFFTTDKETADQYNYKRFYYVYECNGIKDSNTYSIYASDVNDARRILELYNNISTNIYNCYLLDDILIHQNKEV